MSISLAGPRTARRPRPDRPGAGPALTADSAVTDAADDAPRSSRAPLVVAAAIPVLAVLLLAVAPFPLGANAAFMPAFLSLVVVGDVLTGVLLVEHYRAGGGPRLLVLSWAYAWSAATVVPYALTFPGIAGPDGLTPYAPSSAAWLWTTWHVGFALLIGLALMPWPLTWHARLGETERRLRRAVVSHGAVLVTVSATAVLATAGHDLLPTLVEAGDYSATTRLLGPTIAALILASLLAAALGLVRRDRFGLELWAFVALVAVGADSAVSLLSRERFTAGWYGARGLALAAAAVVLIALLSQVTVLYRRGALTTAQLAAHNAELVETQALRDHLVAVVSHDLRAPLAGLAGYLELLDDQDLEGEQALHMIQRSRRLARKLTLQVEDLLAVSTVAHRGLHVRPVLLDLGEQLEEAAGGFPDRDVVVDCPQGLTIHADPVRLQQVLDNLVSNAVKYGAEPVMLRGSDEATSTAHPAGRVLVEVADEGAGVPPEFIERLFERYSRREHEAHAGSGLGLSVVRDLARAHGGEADYDLPGRAFRVWFPDDAAVVPPAEADEAGVDEAGVDEVAVDEVGVLGPSTPGRHPPPALSVDRAV